MRTTSCLLCLAAALLVASPPLRAQAKQEREAPVPAAASNEVGKGTHMGRQELRPGAFITPRYRKAVAQYVQKNHGPGKPCLPGLVKQGDGCGADGPRAWKIGIPVPRTAKVLPLPAGLAAALPKAPPGNEYVLLAGDILLIASASRVVVDAVPRSGP